VVKQFSQDVKRLNLYDVGVTSVYFGGGTPSLMPPVFYEKILWALATTLVMQSDIEVTCEVNPATVDDQWFKRMVKAGINRFSIGVQSFEESKLKVLGRKHTAEDAQRAIAEAQDAGASSVSLDLMYGLPGQKLKEVESDLKAAMTFQPDHISAYELTVESGTQLDVELRRSTPSIFLPGEDEILDQFRLVRRMLSSGDWEPYEISSYAKHGHRCHHNLHYWGYGSYLGLGCGATSFIVNPKRPSAGSPYGHRTATTRELAKYMRGRLSPEENESISKRTAMGEFCFLGLRTMDGISLEEFEKRFGKSLKKTFSTAIGDLENRELIRIEEGILSLTEKGIELSNKVFECFVE
jgi:oxygen-independent coproporphyrinogen-3 oxidase